MGSAASKTVLLVVNTDQACVLSGDYVSGSVVLHVDKEIKVRGVFVKAICKEECKWEEHHQEHRSDGSTVNYTTYFSDNHVIFQHILQLHEASTIQPGDYLWPFHLQLPRGIPGSFEFDLGYSESGFLRYTIQADVLLDTFFNTRITEATSFKVLERCSASPTGPLTTCTDEVVTGCCGISRGSQVLRVTTDSREYVAGTVMHVDAQVENKASVPVKQLKVKLYQTVRLGKDGHSQKCKTYCVASSKEGLSDTDGAPGAVWQCRVDLPLDTNMRPTCVGKVVRCAYRLEVTADTHKGCLSSVSVTQPIAVYAVQQVTSRKPPQPPPGWCPKVFPVAVFRV